MEHTLPSILDAQATRDLLASQPHLYRCHDSLAAISDKVLASKRLNAQDALVLFRHAPLTLVGMLANFVREQKFGHKTYYNKNFHIEPTNVCVFSCGFCAYSCSYKHRESGWQLTVEQMLDIVRSYTNKDVSEVHIVGGVHPKMNLAFFEQLLRGIRALRADIHIKGFTAVELDYMFRKAKVNIRDGLRRLQAAGLQSLPGGGAEIFAPATRQKICADKVDGQGWLAIHRQAHELGMHSNCTILYGHIESFEDRVDHLLQLRDLQDQTKGFNAFIPLKFKNKNNEMECVGECSLVEDMRFYAISRLVLDNIAHIKAYWPMLSREHAQMALHFGADDLDGTIDDSTKIYSMAGAQEQSPAMTSEQICTLIYTAGRQPIERDSLYRERKPALAP